MTFEMPRESIVFLGGVLLSSTLIPLALPVFRRFGVVDMPNARSSHTSAIPRGMGIIVVLAFVVVLGLYSFLVPGAPLEEGGQLEALLWAVLVLVSVGFLDDTRRVPAPVKLVFQCGSAGILIAAGFVMPLPRVFGEHQALVEHAATLLWIVGVVNAVNFIDGSDGLATTLSALCMILFVGISRILPSDLARGCMPLVKAINLLGLAGAGCALPFLLYNIAPARCFLGDAGSTFFGLLLAALGILISRCPWEAARAGVEATFPPGYSLVPWLVLFVPIADAVRVTAGRVLRGRNPLRPDNRHVHHVLHRAGLSPNQMIFLVGLVVFVFGLIAAIIVRSHQSPYILLGVVVLLLYGFVWFFKSSYHARRFVTLALNRRLLQQADVVEGYEDPDSFRNRFEQELARARRHGGALSVLLVAAGSRRLGGRGATPLENPKFLESLLKALRREDVKCRLTSDKVAFLLVETDVELAGHVCDRIGRKFDSIRQGESSDLDVRLGVASFPLDGDTVTGLLASAEGAGAAPRLQLRPAASGSVPAAGPAVVPLGPAVPPVPAGVDGSAGGRTDGDAAFPAGSIGRGPALLPEGEGQRPRWESPVSAKGPHATRSPGAGGEPWQAR
ncbi:MAG: hypothetical protein HY721_14190 [Planctomycetes bacterium]|nr:hypothetical protein [Planctomycetota bacterium]